MRHDLVKSSPAIWTELSQETRGLLYIGDGEVWGDVEIEAAVGVQLAV